MIAVLNWGLDHWWVFFWLAVLGVFDGVRDFFVGCAAAIGLSGERRHQRRLEEIRAAHPVPAEPRSIHGNPDEARTCQHHAVVPVHNTVTGEREAWVCTNPDCRTQLPRNWAVEPSDLDGDRDE
jgi:hypothetical protein